MGQVFRGEILEVLEDGHAVLRLEGTDFSVESRLPLQKGMEGKFQVTALSPQIILKLLPEEEGSLRGIEKYLAFFLKTHSWMENLSLTLSSLWTSEREGWLSPFQETIDRLIQLWSTFSPSRSSQFEPGQIERMILQSGLFFENRLRRIIEGNDSNRFEEVLNRDLKGLLLKLKAEMESLATSPQGSTPRLKELEEAIGLLLSKIVGHQQLTSHLSEIEEKLSLLLPFWIQGHLQMVDLSLSLPSRRPKPSERRGLCLLFLLHFPEWGRMGIEVRLSGKRLYGQFFFTSDQVASFFHHELPRLERGLCHLGFQPELRVSTQTSEKILEQFMNEMKGSEKSLLNLLI